jgi:predicted RNA-binding Zn-ribbon protein involved in translation (DUF1610 family)
MRSGVCPKCGGEEIYGAANGLAVGGSTQAAIHAHIEPGFRGMRPRQMTDGLYQYVCAGCGYLEQYLLDAGAIDFARRNWVRVVKRA